MDLEKVGSRIQDRLYRDGYRKLRKMMRNLDIPLDFTKTLVENEYEIEQSFQPVYAFLLSFLETVALNSVNFSRLQLSEINKKVSVKNTEIEITVNWAKVDESVINFLNRGDSFTPPYFDLVTTAIANGNRNRLIDEYTAYVRGEKTLQDAYDFLRNGLSGSQRANLIVRGEMTEIWSIAQQESYRTSGTIRNSWNTRNDGPKVCPICSKLNGLVTVIGDVFPGTRLTRPGAHLGCRCWLAPEPMTDRKSVV
jgi:SPP1 gp7 family putative phage head morphogenesis protein